MKLISIVVASCAIFATGCASDGSTTLSIGVGSFGGSGGVGGSVSTDLPTGGSDDGVPLPYEQIYLGDPVIEALFPDKPIPFTAETADVETLTEYSANAEPALGDATNDKLARCLDEKAKCRIQRQK